MTTNDHVLNHVISEILHDARNPTDEADALVEQVTILADLITNVAEERGVNSVEVKILDQALLNLTDVAEMLLDEASSTKRQRTAELLGGYADVSLRRIARHTPPQMCGGAILSDSRGRKD